MSSTDTLPRCSFCRKSQNDVLRLIAGPEVYICDECVDICVDILKEDEESGGIEPCEHNSVDVDRFADTLRRNLIRSTQDRLLRQASGHLTPGSDFVVGTLAAHLKAIGIEVESLEDQSFDAPSLPLLLTKSTDDRPSLWIHFDRRCVRASCDDWDREADYTRQFVGALADSPDTLGRLVLCLYVRGSIREFADRLRSLSEELGIRLIAIDENLNVDSAGL